MRTHNTDQAAGIRQMNQARPVRVLAVASGKGGVGKTNVAVNLGVCLRGLGRRVAILDADMGLANVDVMLGLQPKFNLSHVLSGERMLSEVMVEGPSGLLVVPAASGLQRMSELPIAEQVGLIRAFSEIGSTLDVLIVDTAAGIASSVVNFARACQDIILVVCDEPTSMTDAYAFMKLMHRDHGVFRFHILANMVLDVKQGQELYAKLCKVTDRYLDVTLDLMGVIPRDDLVGRAVQRQTPVSLLYPQSKASEAFRALARRVDALPHSERSRGGVEFFVERMIEFHTVVHA